MKIMGDGDDGSGTNNSKVEVSVNTDNTILDKILHALAINNCGFVLNCGSILTKTADYSGNADYTQTADIYASPMEDNFRTIETFQTILERIMAATGKPETARRFKIDENKIYFGGAVYKEKIGEWHEKAERIITIDKRFLDEREAEYGGFKEIDKILEKREPVPGLTGTLVRKIDVQLYPNRAIGQAVINSLDQPLQSYKYEMPRSKFRELFEFKEFNY